jgi:hypothetical protein
MAEFVADLHFIRLTLVSMEDTFEEGAMDDTCKEGG